MSAALVGAFSQALYDSSHAVTRVEFRFRDGGGAGVAGLSSRRRATVTSSGVAGVHRD